jgi:hypothetical protein
MKARPIIACLLALLFSQATLGGATSAQESQQVDSEEELKLTAEEESEVRGIVARFNERMRATNDFGQIIDEMFVKDYSARLWRDEPHQLPWVFLDRNLIAYASGDVLRRYYIASMSFYDSFFRLAEVAEYQKKQSGKTEGGSVLDALSPEIIDVLLSDPTLAEVAKELRKEDEDERAKEVEGHQPAKDGDSSQAAGAASQADNDDTKKTDEIGLIKTHQQLSGVTVTFEKANELMRKRLASMPPIPPPTPGSDDAKSQPSQPEIDLTKLDEDQYGFAQGTPVASVKLIPFYISLVKIEGHFKILTVTVYVD